MSGRTDADGGTISDDSLRQTRLVVLPTAVGRVVVYG